MKMIAKSTAALISHRPARPRRWRVSVRTLLVVVAVVAIPMRMLGVRLDQKRGERQTVQMLHHLRNEAAYDYEYSYGQLQGDGETYSQWDWGAAPYGPRWLRSILGDDFFSKVIYVKVYGADDKLLQAIGSLTDLRVLELHGAKITDDGLSSLAALTNLEELRLSAENVTDAGIAHLAGLKKLRVLDLHFLELTGVGLKRLNGLTRLEFLNLSYTTVKDQDILVLGDFTQLKSIDLDGTETTDAGVRELQKRLPQCEISRCSDCD